MPYFAWSLLESVGLTDVQLQPDSKGKTLKASVSLALTGGDVCMFHPLYRTPEALLHVLSEDGNWCFLPPRPHRVQSLLHCVWRRWPSQAGDGGSGGDAPLPDGTMPTRVRDVRLLLWSAGRGSTSGPAGQVSATR